MQTPDPVKPNSAPLPSPRQQEQPQQGQQRQQQVPATAPLGGDFRADTIYFVITTRFFDGDPSNNFYNRDNFKDGDPHWRGDFKGLIEQLDYIKDLGFTAIWITPPVENRSGLDYHGYHAYDWTRVDPRLESPGATYQDLINAAHAKGIKIVQDVVINHSSNYGIRDQVFVDRLPHKYYRPQGGGAPKPYGGNFGNYLARDREDNDNSLAPAWFRARQVSDPEGKEPLPESVVGSNPDEVLHNPERFFSTDNSKLDPNWYHKDGFIEGGDWENPWAVQHKHMANDCLDLATGRKNVQDYLNGAIAKYLDMGIDAIRLDTAKHVERDELLSYVQNWKERRPDLFVFGEVMVRGLGLGDLDPSDNAPSSIRPWWYTRLGHDARDPRSGGDSGFSVLDFGLFSAFRDSITHGTYAGMARVFAQDWIFGDATKLVTFFQNHDVGPDNDFKFRFAGEDWKAAMAYNLLWTARGIPVLYYGEEIAFMKGAPQDISGPSDTLDQTGRAYFGDHLIGAARAQTESNSLYLHIQRLNRIRHGIPALQRAPMSQVEEQGAGLSFVRDLWDDAHSYAVVGLAAAEAQDFTVNGVRPGIYRDAVTGGTIRVDDGTLRFRVGAHSAGIWVLAGSGKIGVDGVFLRGAY